MPLGPGLLDELRRILGPDGSAPSPEGRPASEWAMTPFTKGGPNAAALPERPAEAVPTVAPSAGGPHCRKYGITANHVLGLELVTGAGEVVRLGGKVADRAGYDLTGVAVGSEGTFGLVTAVTVRLLHTAEAVQTILASFGSIEEASEAVSAIIAAGIIPAALEMLDELMIRAINEGTGAGYPKDAGAVPLIEPDRPRAEGLAQAGGVATICRERGALDVRVARDESERALLWKGRKEAAGAVGRLAPTYLLQDCVVPRSRLPEIMRAGRPAR